MRRYFTRAVFPVTPLHPFSDEIEMPGTPPSTSITVHCAEQTERATGLYDHTGTPIYAVDERTIGFVPSRE